MISIVLYNYLCTQLFECIVKSTKDVFKQLKPCSNDGIHVLFEHGFYLKILKTDIDCLRDVKRQCKAGPE